MAKSIERISDRLLFTPGPLTTSLSVKKAMLEDAGSWHFDFNAMVAELRERVLGVAGVKREDGFECVLMQGSGTFGVESVFSTVIPEGGRLLIVNNGAYGDRMIQMAEALRIEWESIDLAENVPVTAAMIEERMAAHPFSHVAVVHCETTSGILNPIERLGETIRKHGADYIVDAMSSFGALPINLIDGKIDYLISSPNKCLESVPGFCMVIGRREKLLANQGKARCLSLDLAKQLLNFEKKGQFRYTPPTHTLLAFREALDEFDSEGGMVAREKRYRGNHAALISGMKSLGFRPYLDSHIQSPIITSFYYPKAERFEFERFYRALSAEGLVIYPGKLTETECFRIGSIGRLFPSDMRRLVASIQYVLTDMGVETPLCCRHDSD